jgi:hypothetical protein
MMSEKKEDDHLEEASTSKEQDYEKSYALTEEEIHHERRLLTKLDLVIMPLTALLYLSAYLDRGNIGNARLQGLEATLLGGSDTKYSVVLTMFFGMEWKRPPFLNTDFVPQSPILCSLFLARFLPRRGFRVDP